MKKSSVYATVTIDDGVNYREIADTMTQIGFKMNHSSARNYVIRVMKKFGKAVVDSWGMKLSDAELEKICKTSQFQQGICDILQSINEKSKDKKEFK